MHANYWLQSWQQNHIGFHEGRANHLLVQHFSALSLAPGSRVFLPLCGKALDIHWLLAQGHRVAGVEISELAIQQLFAELALDPTIIDHGDLKLYRHDPIEIFVGDYFNLTPDLLGSVDAIYDRAALVALPDHMRQAYSQHLIKLARHAPQLLICFEYNQTARPGPPFSIDAEEIHHHYSDHYTIQPLEQFEMQGKIFGKYAVYETAWLLVPE